MHAHPLTSILIGALSAGGSVALIPAGMKLLNERRSPIATGSTVAVAGSAVLLSVTLASSRWGLRASLMLAVWAAFAVACAACDALTQRVPTRLTRVGATLGAGLLLLCWQLELAAIGVGVALLLYGSALLLVHFGSLGRGDARLALLAGLAAGFGSRSGAVVGICVFVTLPLAQTAWVLYRGGSGRSLIPFGPAIVGCMVALVATPPF